MTEPLIAPAAPDEPLRLRPADLTCARRVLTLAAEAAFALSDMLDGRFSRAVDLLEQASGRVIVSGMGKSGHIARKIAATFASTGAPAFYVHPGEASHGDLGMITRNDVVLALSNSGETHELSDLVAYTRRFRIPLIGMTKGEDSSLGSASDVVLLLPNLGEACPHGLAPTTSTTIMLSYGDALAVALLERRGFTAADFKTFHPGGALGQRLNRVSDLMRRGEAAPWARLDTPMRDALLIMTEKRMGCVGVIDDDGRLLGAFTDGDLRRHLAPDLFNQSLGEVMTPNPVTIRASALAAEALGLMNGRAITTVFAVEDGRAVGVLHIHDLLDAGIA